MTDRANSTYQRNLGRYSFTFKHDAPQAESTAEACAVSSAIEQLVSREAMTYNPDADRVFRRWLGTSRGVDVDVSVDINGNVERLVLVITRTPRIRVSS